MTNFPWHLQSNERDAILAVATALSHKLEGNLVNLYLFGSKARGDYHADSDIDLLVVLNQLDTNSRWVVRATAADYSLQYDVLFNTHLYEKDRWDTIVEYQDTLWREIQRDGISLSDLLTAPTP